MKVDTPKLTFIILMTFLAYMIEKFGIVCELTLLKVDFNRKLIVFRTNCTKMSFIWYSFRGFSFALLKSS